MRNLKSQKYALSMCQILATGFLLSGCGVHYGIEGHRSYSSEASSAPSQYPTLTMETGEMIRAVTPGKIIGGGYWHAIYVENPDVARHLPRDGDFFNGTYIKAVGGGRTKAYYLNSVYIPMEGVVNTSHTDLADWFWIEVIQPDPNR